MRAYLDWLAIVTRDEIALLWPQVEKVAHALVSSVAPLGRDAVDDDGVVREDGEEESPFWVLKAST